MMFLRMLLLVPAGAIVTCSLGLWFTQRTGSRDFMNSLVILGSIIGFIIFLLSEPSSISPRVLNQAAILLVDEDASIADHLFVAKKLREFAGGSCPLCNQSIEFLDYEERPCPLCVASKNIRQTI